MIRLRVCAVCPDVVGELYATRSVRKLLVTKLHPTHIYTPTCSDKYMYAAAGPCARAVGKKKGSLGRALPIAVDARHVVDIIDMSLAYYSLFHKVAPRQDR